MYNERKTPGDCPSEPLGGLGVGVGRNSVDGGVVVGVGVGVMVVGNREG